MGMAGAAKGAAASSPVQVGIPCGWGAPGPSPVMPVPGAHTPSFQLRYRVPQAQLSLAHAGEARGEDMTLAREDGPHGPHSLVGRKPLLGEGGRQGEASPSCLLWGAWRAEQPTSLLILAGERRGGGGGGVERNEGLTTQLPGGPWLATGLERVWARREREARASRQMPSL